MNGIFEWIRSRNQKNAAVVELAGDILKVQPDLKNKNPAVLYLKRWRKPQSMTEPAHIRTIYFSNVLFHDCCQEVYEYVNRCCDLKKLFMDNVRDTTNRNTVVILGLSFALRNLKKLQLLVLRDMDIDEKDGKELFLALSGPDLRVLDLANTRIRKCGTELSISLSRLSELSYINLNGAGMDSNDMSCILQILSKNNYPLIGMILHENNLSGVAELLACCVGKLSFLKLLGISNCKLEEADLIRVIGNTKDNIQILDVGKNGKITSTAGLLHDLLKTRINLQHFLVSQHQFNLLDEKMIEALMVRKRGRLLIDEMPMEYHKLISSIAEECLTD